MTTAQPATQRPAGSVTAGRDYNHVRRNRFEFCVYDAAASKESSDNLLDSIANVTHGFTDNFQYETIEFEIMEGYGYKPGKFKGILKGENANYLFGYGYDNVIAAKVMLAGDAEKIA